MAMDYLRDPSRVAKLSRDETMKKSSIMAPYSSNMDNNENSNSRRMQDQSSDYLTSDYTNNNDDEKI